ncbi:putative pseudaminic acid biosynthesis-associated protein [Candidatus Microthrix parvicella RN1]|uniref:Putative pseudaminic acid biosynthesis-associated protein n=1 Tax=Candidatus Neomicrothrix parvicella RN1 TaxID=1229780 RepID=R4Z2J6_9ACTN|nr:putative pseudaminic acid biosynthesis-associated protein [Candidatus Microthrix parvicella RN1]
MIDVTPLRVAFRADASIEIGTGHVMRCLTLAYILREQGADCSFICRSHPGHLLSLIRTHGFAAHSLPVVDIRSSATDQERFPYADWLGADWVEDADQTLAVLGPVQVDWLIADHYAIDERWEKRVRNSASKLLVLDDLANRPHACDLLLDQTLGRSSADYNDYVPSRCVVLAGPEYALLRPDFASLRAVSLERRASPRLVHLLITMGGVDKANATSRVLASLASCALPMDCRITVVMGAQAPWIREVRKRADDLPWPTEVRVDVRDMAHLMTNSDLMIGAAGSTVWEACCLGLPSLLASLAENQRTIAEALEAAGAAKTATISTVAAGMDWFLTPEASTPSKLSDLSRAAARVTHGRGASIVGQMLTMRGQL